MALNPGAVGKTDSERSERAALHPEGGEPQKNSATTSATANQNGDQPGCRDGVMPEREAPERRRSVQGDVRSCNSSPSPAHRSSEELPRRNFQIPRKTRERKGGCIACRWWLWTQPALPFIIQLSVANSLASRLIAKVLLVSGAISVLKIELKSRRLKPQTAVVCRASVCRQSVSISGPAQVTEWPTAAAFPKAPGAALIRGCPAGFVSTPF